MDSRNDIVLDETREARLGFPEIIYGEHKSADQIARIVQHHRDIRTNLLVTRLQQEKAPVDLPEARYDSVARTLTIRFSPAPVCPGRVAVVSGGASDAPVVAEALQSLAFLGIGAQGHQDIGVAGIHRLEARLAEIRACDVIIVVAGFEGALASVVAGLCRQPVIAVPTSVGYGVAAGGQTALHAMLASCANGLVVTNIDNGCGAALAARRMLGLIMAEKARG